MKKVIDELTSHLKEVNNLRYKLNDKEYWINRAKEAGFIPRKDDWIHVEVTLWHIRVSVYHECTDHNLKEARYWINGKWFDKPFPEKYPDLW